MAVTVVGYDVVVGAVVAVAAAVVAVAVVVVSAAVVAADAVAGVAGEVDDVVVATGGVASDGEGPRVSSWL